MITQMDKFYINLDPRIAALLVQYWTKATLNRGSGKSPAHGTRETNKLTVQLIHKQTHRGRTLWSLIKSIYPNAPERPDVPPPSRHSDGRLVFDYRVPLSPEAWLEEQHVLTASLGVRFSPPPAVPEGARAIRVTGAHPVRAVIVDESLDLSESLRAYDTAGGFNVTLPSRSLARAVTEAGEGEKVKRRFQASLYDYRRSAFMVYD